MDHLVYLCGPITGTSSDESLRWRSYATDELGPEIDCIDPTRMKADHVVRSKKADAGKAEKLRRLKHGKEVVARDRMDVERCDLVLANLSGADRVSIGSVGEIFWADSFRKPIFTIMEDARNPHDHDMLIAVSSCVFTDLDEAIEKLKKFILI